MKAKLVAAFAALFFASLVRADQVLTSTGWVTIPDGSTVTSITLIPYPDGEMWGNTSLVDYSFAGGTGYTTGNPLLGYDGSIDFSSPVSNLAFSWIATDTFQISDNVGDFWADTTANGSSGTQTLPGTDITQLTWFGGDEMGGITALTYTADPTDPPTVPEPSSLLLSGMGLAVIIGLTFRNRAATKQPY
jgi:PEP-CTERM motif